MSFGFGVGDFLEVLKIATSVYQACRDGPKEYKEIANEAKSIQFVINSLCEDAKNPDSLLNEKGADRKDELMEIINNCKATMEACQVLVDKRSILKDGSKGGLKGLWHAYRTGSANLDSMRGKFTLHLNCIQCFLQSLEGPPLVRIEQKIDVIYARMLHDDANYDVQTPVSYRSTASTLSVLSQIETNEDDAWTLIKKELLAENIPLVQLMAHKDTIIEHVKSVMNCDVTSTVVTKPVGYEMPPPRAEISLKGPNLGNIAVRREFKSPSRGELGSPQTLYTHGFDVAAYETGVINGIYNGASACLISFELTITMRQIDPYWIESYGGTCTLQFQDLNLNPFHNINQKGIMTMLKLPPATVNKIAWSVSSSFCRGSCWAVVATRKACIEIQHPGSIQHPRTCNPLALRVCLTVTHDRLPFTLSLFETPNSQKMNFHIKPQSHGDLSEFSRDDLEALTQSSLSPIQW